jgi:paraquat-inducible protein B
MSKPVSKSLIGAFVVVAVALLLVAIAIFGSGRFFAKRPVVVMYFEGSVKGLSVGAPVMFRGVPIGNVTDIRIIASRKERTAQIPVYADFDPTRFRVRGAGGESIAPLENLADQIAAGLRAQLELQSFVTGQLMINVDYYPDTPVVLVGAEPGVPEVPTIPSTMQRLVKKFEDLPIEEIAQNVNNAVTGVARLVNSPELASTITDISKAAKELEHLVGNVNRQVGPLVASINQSVQAYGKLAEDTGKELGNVRQAVQETLGDVRTLVRDVDAEVAPTAAAARDTLGDVRTLVRNADAQVASTAEAARAALGDVRTLVRGADAQVASTAETARDALGDVRTLVRDADAQVASTAETARDTLGDVRTLMRSVDKQVGSVAATLNETLKDYGALARTVDGEVPALAASLQKVLGDAQVTLAKLRDTLGAAEGALSGDSDLRYEITHTLSEVSATARAIRQLANSVNRDPESLIWGRTAPGGQ